MVSKDNIQLQDVDAIGHRIVSTKYPEVEIFNIVADPEDFEDLYFFQSLTNPRLKAEVGNLLALDKSEIPFGITHCSYAVAPFVHNSGEGTRFSSGAKGVLYLADDVLTAIHETRFHWERYLQNIPDLEFEFLVMQSLKVSFKASLHDIKDNAFAQLHLPDVKTYPMTQSFGDSIRASGSEGLLYNSVRHQGHDCYALFSPKHVTKVLKQHRYEYVFNNNRIESVNKVSTINLLS